MGDDIQHEDPLVGNARIEPPSGCPLVVLSTWHPEPADNGRKQRTRAIIAALAADYDVALISLVPPTETRTSATRPVPGVWRQWSLPLPVFRARSAAAVLRLAHPLPRSLVATWSADISQAVNAIVRETGARLVIGTDLRTMRYLTALDDNVRAILDEPDVSPFLIRDGRTSMLSRGTRAILREAKYRRFLSRSATHIDLALVASEDEAEAYRDLAGSDRVRILENGVETIPSDPWTVPTSAQLLYAGALTYAANAEAVAYFVDAILPRLELACPEINLVVTGSIPETLPAQARHARVQFTGRLPSLESVVRESRVFIVPILSGTGTRIKVLEALAAGMPVVSTSKGVEGLAVVPGEHLLIGDTPELFAAAVLRLLDDRALSSALGANGRTLIERRYTWRRLGEELRAIAAEVLGERAGSPRPAPVGAA